MKITLQDKKVLGAFLKHQMFEGRILISDGDTLKGSWGDQPLIAKWDKKGKLIQIPSDDKGVRKAQEALSRLL